MLNSLATSEHYKWNLVSVHSSDITLHLINWKPTDDVQA